MKILLKIIKILKCKEKILINKIHYFIYLIMINSFKHNFTSFISVEK